MNIVIYDCEIKRGIPPRGSDPIPGIEYCNGWRDFQNMGVSVTGAYDYMTDAYRVFCDDNVDEMLETFANADLLVGFNNVGFDEKLLAASYPNYDSNIETPRYDLLVEIWRAAGLKPSWGSPQTHGGFGLDAMCEVNFDARKTGHGADAPVDWQRGRIGKVIDYCLNDIRLTKLLMDAAINGTPLVSPKGGGALYLRSPLLLETEEEMRETTSELTEERPVRAAVDLDEHRAAEARKTLGHDDRDPHHWDNLVIEIEHLQTEDKMMVAVHSALGLVVKRKLMLHEWSQPELNDAFNEKDGPAIIKYLRDHETLYKNIGDDSGKA